MVACLVGVLIYHCIRHLMRVEKSVSRQGTFRPQEATFRVLWNSLQGSFEIFLHEDAQHPPF